MISVTDAKEGMTVRLDGRLFRVLDVLRHSGSGQMHGFVEVKLKDLRTSHCFEKRLRQGDRIEEVGLAKRPMDFLYSDVDACYFMDPSSYEQVGVPHQAMGKVEKFLKEGTRVTVEMLDGEAVAIQFPRVVELAVFSTGPGVRDGSDNTLKGAVLENNMEILVPQFIQTGDHVRVDTETTHYVDRVATRRI
jgi:elongation factor P